MRFIGTLIYCLVLASFAYCLMAYATDSLATAMEVRHERLN